jgi:hypothetical protein
MELARLSPYLCSELIGHQLTIDTRYEMKRELKAGDIAVILATVVILGTVLSTQGGSGAGRMTGGDSTDSPAARSVNVTRVHPPSLQTTGEGDAQSKAKCPSPSISVSGEPQWPNPADADPYGMSISE